MPQGDPQREPGALIGTIALLAVTVIAVFAVALRTADESAAPVAKSSAASSGEPAAKLDPDELLDLGIERTPAVSRRVEKIRELEFGEVPEPQVTDVAELRSLAEAEIAKPKVQQDLETGDIELKLTGLLEPDESLADVATDVTASAAAFYDPKERELFLIGDSVPAGPQVTEFILAHELDHALEDQVFGLPTSTSASDDQSLAETSLIEGSATALMTEYARRYLNQFDLLREASAVGSGAGSLPPVAEQQVLFTYYGGARFVDELRATAGGSWKLVDFAYESRPPVTTEQIIHPEKYLEDEGPLEVTPPTSPGEGWEELDSGTLGEFTTRQLLRLEATDVGADTAAAGWGGDAYRLFGRVGAECRGACRNTHALAIAWRGDDAAEAEELAKGLRGYVERALSGTEGPDDLFQLADGWAAVSLNGDRVGLALAPDQAVAARLAAPVG